MRVFKWALLALYVLAWGWAYAPVADAASTALKYVVLQPGQCSGVLLLMNFVTGASCNNGGAVAGYANIPGMAYFGGVLTGQDASGVYENDASGNPVFFPLKVNAIRTSTMPGAASGSPGTLPTNWTTSDSGLTRTVTPVIANGQSCLNLRWAGTSTSTGISVFIDGISVQSGAASGQTYTGFISSAVVAGSLTGFTSEAISVVGYNSGTTVENATAALGVTGTLTRTTVSRTFNNALTNQAGLAIFLPMPMLTTVDLTLQLCAPELVQASSTIAGALPYTPTSGTAINTTGPRVTSAGYWPWIPGSNLLTFSGALTNAVWGQNGVTLPSSTVIAPDGSASAFQMLATSGSSIHSVSRIANVTVASGATVTETMDFQYSNTPWFALSIFDTVNHWGNVNVQTCTGGGVTTGVTMTVQARTSGWCRVSITYTITGTSVFYGVYMMGGNSTSSLIWTALGTETGNIDWAQLETQPIPGHYVPTTSVTITYTADVLTFAGVLQPASYTWYARGTFTDGQTSGTFPHLMGGASDNGIYVSTAARTAGANMGSGTYNVTVPGIITNGQTVRIGFRGQVNNARAAAQGVLTTLFTTFTPSVGATTIQVGSTGGTNQWNGPVQAAEILNNPANDNQLQALTLTGP